jgi:actin-like ATPase involved in cell morphogenesis
MTYHLGVDLGTTYTAAAVARDGRAEAVTLGTRSVSVPSVVHLAGDQVVVGEPAARRATTEPAGVVREFKRRVGDPTPILVGGAPIAAELLMARTLAWVVEQVSATEGGPPASLAVTHPANWGRYKLDLFDQAARHVGLTVDRFVPEPVAAATTYAVQRDLAPGTAVAVYDLGGGTFDAAVVRVGDDGFHIAGRPDGVERLGGIDFDHAVFRHVLAALGIDPDALDPGDEAMAAGLARLRSECVEAKEALSTETDVSIPVMLPSRHTTVRLTRAELEAMIRPALAETVVALRRAIASADLAPADVSAVLLVGGSSRIPLVGQMVASDLGLPIAVDARPKDAIPVGAALTAMRAEAPAPVPEPSPAVAAAVPVVPITAAPPAPAVPEAAPDPLAVPPPPPGVAHAPTPPAAVPAAAPAGPPPGPSAPSRRPLLLVAVALVAVGAVAGALLASREGGGGEEAGDDTTTTTRASTSTTSTTSGGPLTTDLDVGEFGTGSGQTTALPGEDWNPEARASFVEQCTTTQLGNNFQVGGIDPTEGCGCIYDQVSQEVTFADFNEQWTSDEDVDTGDPTVVAMANATTSCVIGG